MRHTSVAATGIAVIGLLCAHPAHAQFGGALHTARPLETRTTDIGPYAGLFDAEKGGGTALAVFGQLRHGFFPDGDGGLKFGLVDSDDDGDVGIFLTGDLQWALLSPRWGDPFWMALGPEVGLYSTSDSTTWGFAGNLISSYDFKIRTRRVSPYARLTIRLEVADSRGGSDTNLRPGFNPGVLWEAGDFFDCVAELQFEEGHVGILAGINFRL